MNLDKKINIDKIEILIKHLDQLHYVTPILVPCVLISCRKAAIKHEISAKVGHQFKANVPVSSN